MTSLLHTYEGSDTWDFGLEERPPMFTFYGFLAYCGCPDSSNSNNLKNDAKLWMKLRPSAFLNKLVTRHLVFTHNLLALLDKISELEVSSLPLQYISAQTARNGLQLGPSYLAYKTSTVCCSGAFLTETQSPAADILNGLWPHKWINVDLWGPKARNDVKIR